MRHERIGDHVEGAGKGDEKAENELELEANTPLQDFELEVSQNCLANPKWRITL